MLYFLHSQIIALACAVGNRQREILQIVLLPTVDFADVKDKVWFIGPSRTDGLINRSQGSLRLITKMGWDTRSDKGLSPPL
jgi:hypothetical protein